MAHMTRMEESHGTHDTHGKGVMAHITHMEEESWHT